MDSGRETAIRIAKEYPGVKVSSAGEQEIRLSHTMTKQEIARMIGVMIANDVVVTGFHKQEGNLETLFMRVTGGNDTEGGAENHSAGNCESGNYGAETYGSQDVVYGNVTGRKGGVEDAVESNR